MKQATILLFEKGVSFFIPTPLFSMSMIFHLAQDLYIIF